MTLQKQKAPYRSTLLMKIDILKILANNTSDTEPIKISYITKYGNMGWYVAKCHLDIFAAAGLVVKCTKHATWHGKEIERIEYEGYMITPAGREVLRMAQDFLQSCEILL